MTRRHTTEQLLNAWRRTDVPDATDVEESAATVGRIKGALAEVSRRRVRTRHRYAAAAFAIAAAAAVFVAVQFRAERAQPVAAQVPVYAPVVVLDRGPLQQLQPGAEFFAQQDAERLRFASGAVVKLSTGTRVQLSERQSPDEQFSLTVGHVLVEVPKLGPDRGFIVETQHAQVVVHGTKFSVDVAGTGSAAVTTVEVAEGRVGVFAGGEEILLDPGDRWTSRLVGGATADEAPHNADTEVDQPSTPSRQKAHASNEGRVQHAPDKNASVAQEPSPASKPELEQQNQLFTQAVTAARRGQLSTAARLFADFEQRYPRSPVVQEATVQRFRVLQRMGRVSDAQRIARRYLATYPGGFAREEAKRLVLER